MRKPTAALVFIFLIFSNWLLMTTKAQKEKDASALSKAQWREDLQYFARELAKRHKNLFHTVTREQFEQSVAELDAAITTLAHYQITVKMLQITADCFCMEKKKLTPFDLTEFAH